MKKILLLAALLCLTACTGSNDSNDLTLVLDWTPNTNHTGFYVANELGYYTDEGLMLDIIQPPEDGAYALVASGKANFCIGFQETLAAALTADHPLGVTAIAAIIDNNTSGIISSKEKGIDSFAKMEGRTYATWDTPLERQVIEAVMEKQGGDVDKVIFIPSTVTDVVAALTTDIDTVWVYEGWEVAAARVAGFDYNYIDFADVMPELNFYTPILVADDSFLSENPDIVKRFMRATVKGFEYAIANPTQAAEILIKAVPELDGDLVYESQRFLAGEYKADKEIWGTFDEARWTAFYNWAYQTGVISKPLGNAGFTNEFLY